MKKGRRGLHNLGVLCTLEITKGGQTHKIKPLIVALILKLVEDSIHNLLHSNPTHVDNAPFDKD